MNGISFNLLSELGKHVGEDKVAVLVNGRMTPGDTNGGIYRYDETSTLPHDGFDVYAVENVAVGRWIRQRNTNYSIGSANLPSISLTTKYTINHNLGMVPKGIWTEPMSLQASQLHYVGDFTETTFSITFAAVPLLTNNYISFLWLAVK